MEDERWYRIYIFKGGIFVANGFMGKMLWVDLGNGKMTVEDLDEKLARDYIGGYGLGARILYERMKPNVDPLGPENILGLITGPLAGTPALGGSRYTVVTKSPLTGGWGDANSGGTFGPKVPPELASPHPPVSGDFVTTV